MAKRIKNKKPLIKVEVSDDEAGLLKVGLSVIDITQNVNDPSFPIDWKTLNKIFSTFGGDIDNSHFYSDVVVDCHITRSILAELESGGMGSSGEAGVDQAVYTRSLVVALSAFSV